MALEILKGHIKSLMLRKNKNQRSDLTSRAEFKELDDITQNISSLFNNDMKFTELELSIERALKQIRGSSMEIADNFLNFLSKCLQLSHYFQSTSTSNKSLLLRVTIECFMSISDDWNKEDNSLTFSSSSSTVVSATATASVCLFIISVVDNDSSCRVTATQLLIEELLSLSQSQQSITRRQHLSNTKSSSSTTTATTASTTIWKPLLYSIGLFLNEDISYTDTDTTTVVSGIGSGGGGGDGDGSAHYFKNKTFSKSLQYSGMSLLLNLLERNVFNREYHIQCTKNQSFQIINDDIQSLQHDPSTEDIRIFLLQELCFQESLHIYCLPKILKILLQATVMGIAGRTVSTIEKILRHVCIGSVGAEELLNCMEGVVEELKPLLGSVIRDRCGHKGAILELCESAVNSFNINFNSTTVQTLQQLIAITTSQSPSQQDKKNKNDKDKNKKKIGAHNSNNGYGHHMLLEGFIGEFELFLSHSESMCCRKTEFDNDGTEKEKEKERKEGTGQHGLRQRRNAADVDADVEVDHRRITLLLVHQSPGSRGHHMLSVEDTDVLTSTLYPNFLIIPT
eukprot:gene2182-4243_t